MNINELRLSNELKYENKARILEKYGWEILGNGYYSFVAEHPRKKYVLKMFTKNNMNYSKFVKFCREHQDNPHVPQFSRDVKFIPNTNKEWLYVRMEKLTPLPRDDYNNFLPELCYIVSYGKTKHLYFSQLEELVLSLLKLTYGDENNDKIFLDTAKNCSESFKQIINDLLRFMYDYGIRGGDIDLHRHNMMERNGVLVITDPFIG